MRRWQEFWLSDTGMIVFYIMMVLFALSPLIGVLLFL